MKCICVTKEVVGYCRKEESHLPTVVMIPGTLDECVLSVKEAKTLFYYLSRRLLSSHSPTL